MTACQAVVAVIYCCFSTFTSISVVVVMPDSNTKVIDVALLRFESVLVPPGNVRLFHR
jgi:hypothetical protein